MMNSWRNVVLTGVTVLAVWLLADLALRYALNQFLPSMERISKYRDKPGLHAKIAHYKQHAGEYNVIYVGDSRTYCGIAPDLLDKALGTHSINLSGFGNWFPTQYASLKELLRYTPPGTVVVWSIGHQNFQRVFDKVNLMYPIGLGDVPEFRRWGFTWGSLQDNVLDGVPGLKPYVRRQEIRERFENLLLRTVQASSAPADARGGNVRTVKITGEHEMAAWRSNPDVLYLEPIYANGEMTSFAAYMRGGNYVRVELDPGFFRRKQQESASTLKPLPTNGFTPDPEYWNNFLGIVSLFAEHDVQLIVNEFEEAPYNYAIPENRRVYRNFMNKVRDFLIARGIPYVRVDFDQLRDAEYFDYNHLNSEGIVHFSTMLDSELKPLLASRPLRAVQ